MSMSRSLRPEISRQVLKLRDRVLLEGAMATSALVAMADGRIQLEEDLTVSSLLDNLEMLRVYDPNFAVSLHTAYVEHLREDFASGKALALETIARCHDDIEGALLLVKVGIAIAKADSVFTQEEVSMIEEICRCLEIDGLDALGLAGSRGGKKAN